MVELTIENKILPLESIWYHHRSSSYTGHSYAITISLSEKELISLIEKYAGVSIVDDEFEHHIIKKDSERLSLGLIGQLLLAFKKNGYVNKGSDIPMTWTINNIKRVFIMDNKLVIAGDASK